MIVFHKLRYRNFLASGNLFTEINLDLHSTTLIVGLNGAGKTTFIEAFCYVLFNRSLRGANKPTLINAIIGRNLLVEVEFSANGAHYLVRRGMRPNVFEIWKNGVLLDQTSGIVDYQSILEKQILKMNVKSFTQIVVLGSGNYVPFMQLPAQARRDVIEDLLDIQVFSTMNNILKERIKDNDKTLQELEFNIAINDNSIKQYDDYAARLARMNAELMGEKRARAQELEILCVETKQAIAELQEQYEQNDTQQAIVLQKIEHVDELCSLADEWRNRLLQLKREKDFYETNRNCPTCKQSLLEEFRLKQIERKREAAERIEAALKDVEVTFGPRKKELNDRWQELLNQRNALSNLKANKEATLKHYQNDYIRVRTELDELSEKLKPNGMGTRDELERLDKEYKIKKEELISTRELYNSASILLKDGGIKSRIVRQYIPIINHLINKYLESFDFFISFNLDENFQENILSRNRDDFNYESFSEGEKVRINLAILFAWMSIAKLRNSVSCSLLIMDEILDGSLDECGTEAFLQLLKPVIGDRNAFVISHKWGLKDKFDKVLEFQKIKNFSHLIEVA